MDHIQVRFASPIDEVSCQRLDRHLPTSSFAGKTAAQELILVERHNEAIGYLRLEYLWGTIPYIGRIWIDASHRGQGIGKALLAFLEAHLRQHGHRMLLSSSQANEADPQAWHRSAGFRECGILAGLNEGGIGEIFFRKDL